MVYVFRIDQDSQKRNETYSNWDRSPRTKSQRPRNSPRKSTVLRPTQECILRKCGYCDDFFYDLPKHHNEIHNIIGEKLVAPIGNGAVFSPSSQTKSNEDLTGIEKIKTGPKTPNGKRFSFTPKRYKNYFSFYFLKKFQLFVL